MWAAMELGCPRALRSTFRRAEEHEVAEFLAINRWAGSGIDDDGFVMTRVDRH